MDNLGRADLRDDRKKKRQELRERGVKRHGRRTTPMMMSLLRMRWRQARMRIEMRAFMMISCNLNLKEWREGRLHGTKSNMKTF